MTNFGSLQLGMAKAKAIKSYSFQEAEKLVKKLYYFTVIDNGNKLDKAYEKRRT